MTVKEEKQITLTHLSIWTVNVVSVKSAVTPKNTVNYVHIIG